MSDPAPPLEPNDAAGESLREAQDRFISLWGRMGTSWGIPRTMAEVHAFLFIAGAPCNADEVVDRLAISRGNASMTLRRLVEWGLVSRVRRKGDRKEYFLAEQDVWKMFRTVLAQRKKREIDPLLEAIEGCRPKRDRIGERRVDPGAAAARAHNDRLDDLADFIRIVDTISRRFLEPRGAGLEIAAKLLERAS